MFFFWSINNQTKCPLTPNTFTFENSHVHGFMREIQSTCLPQMSHMLTHNVLSSPRQSLPPPSHPPLFPTHLSLISLSPSFHYSHSYLTRFPSLSSSLSSLVHNFTAVIRQSHSFHQRDQELIFLGRGSLDL